MRNITQTVPRIKFNKKREISKKWYQESNLTKTRSIKKMVSRIKLNTKLRKNVNLGTRTKLHKVTKFKLTKIGNIAKVIKLNKIK